MRILNGVMVCLLVAVLGTVHAFAGDSRHLVARRALLGCR